MKGRAQNEIAKSFVEAFERHGSTTFISNLVADVSLHQWGEHLVPLTCNSGETGSAFSCSPRIAYIDYTKEELGRFPNRALVPLLHIIVNAVGMSLRKSNLDYIVHINNWMMSTNLPVGLDPRDVEQQTQDLVAKFPGHILAVRSLTHAHSGPLLNSLTKNNWILLPSRQVFLVDNVLTDSMPRRDVQNDQKLWDRSAFTYHELDNMCDADAQRISELYALLYLEKYSHINPAYTARFVKMTHEIGMIRYLVLRDETGCIQGFGGMVEVGNHATMPLIGYDTGLSRSLGLYRLVCHAGSLYAARHQLRFNMSSGAAAYKMTRGATPEMEFTAFYIGHLPLMRRIPFVILRAIGNKVAIPLMRRYQL